MKRRTGSGVAINPDAIGMHWLTIVLLVSALVAAGVASIDGLLHAAEWMVPPPLRWTLPVAVDVFLVATALATLALRKRGHLLAAATTEFQGRQVVEIRPEGWVGPGFEFPARRIKEVIALLRKVKSLPEQDDNDVK